MLKNELFYFVGVFFINFVFFFFVLKKSFKFKEKAFFIFFILIIIPFFEVGSYASQTFSEELMISLNMLLYFFYILLFYNLGGKGK